MSIRIVKKKLKWDGTLVKGEVLESVECKKFVYWKIRVDKIVNTFLSEDSEIDEDREINEEYWVIRRMITDLRPVITERLKKHCKMMSLGSITMKHRGRLYTLTKSRDPHIHPELPLNVYIRDRKIEDIPMYFRRQIQQVYSFRQLVGMNNNADSSLVVRIYRSQLRVYSVIDTFPTTKRESPKNLRIPETIFNRWFDSKDYNTIRTTHYYTADIIGVYRDMDGHYTDEDFEDSLEDFDNFLTSTIKSIDPDLLWFHGDIIKLIIQKATP